MLQCLGLVMGLGVMQHLDLLLLLPQLLRPRERCAAGGPCVTVLHGTGLASWQLATARVRSCQQSAACHPGTQPAMWGRDV